VTVYLPAAEAEAVADAGRRVRADVSGTETVLVVDDDEAVRNIVAEMLVRHGYEVVAVTTSDAALLMVEEGLRPDVLVSDVVMPRIGGLELAERLVQLHPELRVILSSGYTEHGLLDAGASTLSPLLLTKPFSADQLAATIRESLER
jgi:CheY-like chemotaxis protein